MTRREAVAVQKVLLALIAQKHTLSMVGIGIGMTAYDGEILGAATELAAIAHGRLAAGIDSFQLERAWRDERELARVFAEIKEEARCGSEIGTTLTTS